MKQKLCTLWSRALGPLAIGSCLTLAGCSADASNEPEPTLETPGTFVATPREKGGYRLLRVRDFIRLSDQATYLFLDEYFPGASTLAEARKLARRHDLPLLHSEFVDEQQFEELPLFIVWYRSLNDEEKD